MLYVLTTPLVLHDNAPALNALVAKVALRYCGLEELSQPPYSTDLTLSDFHLFPSLKGHIRSKHFEMEGRKCFFFTDSLNTFYLRLYRVGHMVEDHSDSERENLLPPHGLLFPISTMGSFICTIPQTG